MHTQRQQSNAYSRSVFVGSVCSVYAAVVCCDLRQNGYRHPVGCTPCLPLLNTKLFGPAFLSGSSSPSFCVRFFTYRRAETHPNVAECTSPQCQPFSGQARAAKTICQPCTGVTARQRSTARRTRRVFTMIGAQSTSYLFEAACGTACGVVR